MLFVCMIVLLATQLISFVVWHVAQVSAAVAEGHTRFINTGPMFAVVGPGYEDYDDAMYVESLPRYQYYSSELAVILVLPATPWL